MSYVYSQVSSLAGKQKVGSTQCVALVQFYAGVPRHSNWKQGPTVMGNREIVPGTAIATFIKGRYPSRPHGNHAAFFLRHAADGFWVVDQWKDRPGQAPRNIEARYIRSKHVKQNADGTWPYASDNADAFFVIESR